MMKEALVSLRLPSDASIYPPWNGKNTISFAPEYHYFTTYFPGAMSIIVSGVE